MKRISGALAKNRLLALSALLGLVILGLPFPLRAVVTPALTNAFLFVTQVPQPREVNDATITNVFLGVGAGFGNHLPDTLHAPRGGDLWLHKTNNALTNLTRALGYGVAGAQHTNGIAVREPSVHWSGTKALFSMIVGSPRNAADATTFFWQLYEITGLPDGPYAITKVSGQPTNYNNVSPCYLPDGHIVFATDRPRDGAEHLYPQLDEYNDFPTVTGLWNLNPTNGDLHILNHTPSGAFSPSVDSFGRLIFVRWDHLVQDRNATQDRLNQSTNGTFNFANESATSAYDLSDRSESFPEPRTFDGTNLAVLKVAGNAINNFFPWTMFLDGTGEEILNHMGRHDFSPSGAPFRRSFTNDPNLVDFTLTSPPRSNLNYFINYFWIREDPRTNGLYYGIDAPDFGSHAAGQILTVNAPAGLNADSCFLGYITAKSTAGPNAAGVYRNPMPLSDGSLVATYASNGTNADANIGTATLPVPRYNFRLYALAQSGGLWSASVPVTSGLSNNPSGSVVQYVGGQLITNTGPLWELFPVEVRSNATPTVMTNFINSTELQVFGEEGVDVAQFQNYLRVNDLALVVSHNVTRRDQADHQQPFNLRIAGTTNATVNPTSNTNYLYDLAHIQFLQADQRRGYTGGGVTPQPGRRALATLLHEPAADNVANPVGPAGSLKLGDDGSFAALLPARRAMTWQLLGTNIFAPTNSIVKERYWVTFQPGEIRTCKNCHGINTGDQAGNPPPNNPPQALRDLLRYWKTNNTSLVKVLNDSGSNYLSLTFKRRAGVSNVLHTVQLSDDLSNWLDGSFYSEVESAPDTPLTTQISRSGTNTETITVREKAPLGSASQRFMRVRVSAP